MIMQSNMGYGHLSDGYDLALWLNPKHAVNKHLSDGKYRRLVLHNAASKHTSVYGYWEYIRRYMTGDGVVWFPISEEPRTATFDAKDFFLKELFVDYCSTFYQSPHCYFLSLIIYH